MEERTHSGSTRTTPQPWQCRRASRSTSSCSPPPPQPPRHHRPRTSWASTTERALNYLKKHNTATSPRRSVFITTYRPQHANPQALSAVAEPHRPHRHDLHHADELLDLSSQLMDSIQTSVRGSVSPPSAVHSDSDPAPRWNSDGRKPALAAPRSPSKEAATALTAPSADEPAAVLHHVPEARRDGLGLLRPPPWRWRHPAPARPCRPDK